MAKTYRINEVFYSLQGEGIRAGEPSVFVRFSGCNLACDLKEGLRSPGGFACDTEFMSGRDLTLEEIEQYILRMQNQPTGPPNCKWLVLTGGEPALQVDFDFLDYFKNKGYLIAIETNGSIKLPYAGDGLDVLCPFDWVTVSPKVAEHAIKQLAASEVKYVRGYGQGIPKTVVQARHYIISPAFQGNELDLQTLDWCIKLCLENPKWQLSVQQHKTWKVR